MSSGAGEDLSALQRAILLTVLYSDLFDYPLTEDELHRYLVAPYPVERAFKEALQDLMGPHLTRVQEFLTLSGREHIVEVRRQRQQIGKERWSSAARYARWLRYVPFVRMVAVCGSQAAGNARPDADVDFFLITAPGRLWTVQVYSMFLRRIASWLSVRVCPNYFLTLDSLEVEPRNLYHAREIAQAVPLWGDLAYIRFLDANRWIEQFLPNVSFANDRRDRLVDAPRPRLARGFEWLLGGRLGHVLERTLHKALLAYYPLRLYHLGWRRKHFRRSYRDDRQEVMRGGYGPVVEREFRDRVAERFGQAVAASELARLFPPRSVKLEPDRVYANLYSERYGQGHD
jgi:hypothetical protein